MLEKINEKLLPTLEPHVVATLDLIDRLLEIYGSKITSVEAEVNRKHGNIDLRMVINRMHCVFEVKGRYAIISEEFLNLINISRTFVDKHLSSFGVFSKAITDSKSIRILESKKYGTINDYSIGLLFLPINTIEHREVRRVVRKIKKGCQQLENSDEDYKIVVYDARYTPVSTELLIREAEKLLAKKYNSHLNGIMYIRWGLRNRSKELIPYLILVPNRNVKNPIDIEPYRSKQSSDILLEPIHVFTVPIVIKIERTGWIDLLDIKPGFKIFRKNVLMGYFTPP